MKQLELEGIGGWGGKRKGAGRKNKSKTVNHMKRAVINPRHPLHVTWKFKPGLISLRGPKIHQGFKLALGRAKKKGLRVLHYALERDHIHLFVEGDNESVAKGFTSLGGRFGKAVRKYSGGRGSVLKGRYHVRHLKTPRQTKNALAYVLLNHSKHEGGRPYVDRYSSAEHFKDWGRLVGSKYRPPDHAPPHYLSEARTWLAKSGWVKGPPLPRWERLLA